MEEIIRFQDNMLLIRRIDGWIAEEFGEKIGVTRQTINKLEKSNRAKFKLSKTQYIAMRSVLDAEITKYPEGTEGLRLILDMLVDYPKKYKKKEIQPLFEKANMITLSIFVGTATRKAASKEVLLAMGMVLGGVVADSVVGNFNWTACGRRSC